MCNYTVQFSPRLTTVIMRLYPALEPFIMAAATGCGGAVVVQRKLLYKIVKLSENNILVADISISKVNILGVVSPYTCIISET